MKQVLETLPSACFLGRSYARTTRPRPEITSVNGCMTRSIWNAVGGMLEGRICKAFGALCRPLQMLSADQLVPHDSLEYFFVRS